MLGRNNPLNASNTMGTGIKRGTLRLSWPIGQTAAIAVVAVAILCAAAEIIARDRAIQRDLPRPMINGHPQVAHKLQLLDRLEAREGPVDCFLIGSSLVREGIEPATLNDAAAKAGRPLRCFNFGLDDVDMTGTAVLARVLVEMRHPALIVYGTSYRDFSDARGVGLDIPWADAWLGKPSLDGWLEAHSTAFRFVQAYRDLADGTPPDQTHLSIYGFFDGKGIADVSKPPPNNPDGSEEGKLVMALSEDKLDHLNALAEIARGGTEVLIVEMPQPGMTIDQLANGQQDYQLFLDTIAEASARHGLPFAQAQGNIAIPDDGWRDYKHMNGSGARVFSAWLGEILARGL